MEHTPKLKHQDTARLDKWLWAARIFKTRTIAANACKNSRVSVSPVGSDGSAAPSAALAKPSRTVKCGEVIHVKKSPVTYTFRVKQAIEKHVGAKLLPDILEDITTPEQYEILEMQRISGFVGRAKGTGRPTKKDRRALDDFAQNASEDMSSFLFDFDE